MVFVKTPPTEWRWSLHLNEFLCNFTRQQLIVMNYSSDKISCFLVDYGIYSDCNLACHYCRLTPVKNKDDSERTLDSLKTHIEGLTNVSKHVNAVMFKASGWGEITQLPEYMQLFRHAKDLGYKVLQLITNGTSVLAESVLGELQGLGFFSLQMSIDGLNHSENKYRFKENPQMLKRFFDNLHRALRMGIPIEINTVLTDANTATLHPLLNVLLRLREKYDTPVVCVPRRVKIKPHLDTHNLVPSGPLIDELEKTIIGRYSKYSSVLPPKPYLTGLIHFLRTGSRNWVCYDSLVRINIGASGDIVIHTTSGKKLLGSVLGPDHLQSFERRSRLHTLTGEPEYQEKMNQFDIHYLYLGGKLSLREISRIPSCANPVSRKYLQNLRRTVRNAETKTSSFVQSLGGNCESSFYLHKHKWIS